MRITKERRYDAIQESDESGSKKEAQRHYRKIYTHLGMGAGGGVDDGGDDGQ